MYTSTHILRIILLTAVAVTGCSADPAPPPAPPLALACLGCHGPAGRSEGDIPDLAGMPRERFLARMAEFAAGGGDVMNRIAPAYEPQELARLADYFAELESTP